MVPHLSLLFLLFPTAAALHRVGAPHSHVGASTLEATLLKKWCPWDDDENEKKEEGPLTQVEPESDQPNPETKEERKREHKKKKALRTWLFKGVRKGLRTRQRELAETAPPCCATPSVADGRGVAYGVDCSVPSVPVAFDAGCHMGAALDELDHVARVRVGALLAAILEQVPKPDTPLDDRDFRDLLDFGVRATGCDRALVRLSAGDETEKVEQRKAIKSGGCLGGAYLHVSVGGAVAEDGLELEPPGDKWWRDQVGEYIDSVEGNFVKKLAGKLKGEGGMSDANEALGLATANAGALMEDAKVAMEEVRTLKEAAAKRGEVPEQAQGILERAKANLKDQTEGLADAAEALLKAIRKADKAGVRKDSDKYKPAGVRLEAVDDLHDEAAAELLEG